TEIIGVVSDRASAVKQSFEAGHLISTSSARTFADGMACRDPHPEALQIIRAGVGRIVSVSDDEVADAIRVLFADTHNLAEGAGAAGLAALLRESGQLGGKRVAVILSGANIDTTVFREV